MDDIRGLSDSPLIGSESQAKCDRCGATTRLDKGTCVSCLLLEGLQAEGEASSEVFENVLEEAGVPDKEWRLGNYEIIEEIGRGGMGVIYRARQRYSRRIVAVKCLLSYHADSHETLVRFRREAEAAASLDHPNILPIYEVSESEDGRPFFSMKFAPGGSLCDAGPSLRAEPRECVRLMAKVARATECAHGQGILHRDLKPGNILLDGWGEPLVSDFGLAKWLDANTDLTRTLTTFGTPGYIAPEQAQGAAGDLTPAADIYSLGAMLFELLTGRPPFLGSNAISVIRQAAETPAPKLRSLARLLDRDLETVVARCLERDPRARYRSASALAEDLENWLEHRPVRARPVPPHTKLWRWARRNPVLSATASGCLLLPLAVAWFLAPAFPEGFRTPVTEKSIAILPFENLSPDENNAFYAEGMQEDIITALARIAELKVIGRRSVREYKADAPRDLREIARALGVGHVLAGSVRRADDRVQITAVLTDARTGTSRWTRQYDRKLEDVFAVQGEIAGQLADHLRARLSATERASMQTSPTTDMLAYDLFLKAQKIDGDMPPNEERLLRMVSLLQEAVARDPAFVRALCALARAHLWLYWFDDHSATRLALATKAMDEAARLQPEAGEVHFARGMWYWQGYRDHTSALKEFTLARQSLPNDADIRYFVATVEARQGNWDESIRQLEQARAVDPRDLRSLFQLIVNHGAIKRYQEAAEICEGVLAWQPDSLHLRRARAWIEQASKADLRLYRELVTRNQNSTFPADALALDRLQVALWERDFAAAREALAGYSLPNVRYGVFVLPKEYYAGQISLHLGERERAEMELTAAREKVTAFIAIRPDDAGAHMWLGDINARLGRKEEAIRAGERAVELCSVENDASDGPIILVGRAAIYSLIGENGRALELLSSAAKIPRATCYGDLMLDDTWDNLRSDPRFSEILASLAVKSPPAL